MLFHLPSIAVLFTPLLFIDVAYAQQPLAELGGWPSGSFILFVGTWLAFTCLSASRFDILLPIILARLPHKVPALRRFLTLSTPCGFQATQLVLTQINHTGHPISQEWDTLILLWEGSRYSFDNESLTVELSDGEERFDFQIDTGVDVARFVRAADTLLDTLDLGKGTDMPRFDKLLRLWHGLRMYQKYRHLAQWDDDLDAHEFENAVQSYKAAMGTSDCSRLAIHPALSQIMLSVNYPSSQHQLNEVSQGSTTERAVSAKELAAMLAFTEYVCEDCSRSLNPLLLCVWIWLTGQQHHSDNMVLRLPHLQSLVYPQRRIKEIFSSTLVVLDLSGEDWDIDGAHSAPGAWLLVFWFLSLLTASVIAFFAVISGHVAPNLATTLGLFFARPYSRDSYLGIDAGYPPSWNGRRQIRWSNGYACGIFKGRFYRQMGPSGSSVSRALAVYATSWIAYVFRSHFRSSLHLTISAPAPAPWVRLSASAILLVSTLAWTGITIWSSIAMVQRFGKMSWLKAFASSASQSVELFFIISYYKGNIPIPVQETLSLFLLAAYAMVIPRGVSPAHREFALYGFAVWVQMIWLNVHWSF